MRRIDADALSNRILLTTYTKQGLYTLNLLSRFVQEALTVDGWISVKDRLPEKDGEYLVFVKTGCITICWYDGQKWIDDGCEWAGKYVSHWAELPKPPKEVPGMPDMEKVIRAVETCFDSWIDKHRNMGLDLHEAERMKHDALELLKEHEPVKPISAHVWARTFGRCGNCEAPLPALEGRRSMFCWMCGRKVKWDD